MLPRLLQDHIDRRATYVGFLLVPGSDACGNTFWENPPKGTKIPIGIQSPPKQVFGPPKKTYLNTFSQVFGSLGKRQNLESWSIYLALPVRTSIFRRSTPQSKAEMPSRTRVFSTGSRMWICFVDLIFGHPWILTQPMVNFNWDDPP